MAHSLITAESAPKTKYDLLAETQAAQAPTYEFQEHEKPLSFWRRLIGTAVYNATRTREGQPTDAAILERNWIERRTDRTDREAWSVSFECACEWLDLDPAAERTRLLKEINDALVNAAVLHVGSIVYQRTAVVLSLATGVPRSVGRQFVLTLVSPEEYELIAGIDIPDPGPRRKKKPLKLRKAA